MLSVEQQKQIAKLLKLDEATFLAAITAEQETTVDIPTVSVFTSQELQTRDTNQERIGYDKGKDAGLDLFIKDQKKAYSLDFEGKDPAKFMEAIQGKILADAKVEPNKQLSEKEDMIKTLQASVASLQAEANNAKAAHQTMMRKNKLMAAVPAGLPLDKDEVILAMESKGYSFEDGENGEIVTKLNGQVVRDQSTAGARAHSEVVSDFIKERKWPAEPKEDKTGRGDKTKLKTVGISKMSEAKAAWTAEGKSENSADFQAYVNAIAKENPNFDIEN
ncbi:hypothetical protein [Chitinophaga sp. sic0106]|uniref:hypothetical protein n=1 Tax=Chitinophaga sp. sic0106 TaxID=2854785 RepID=UPI001C46B9C4|nr:hypothetical protein [Chitinophaga sp. sic0106]MBV7531339.1 hypothetical protein [Chitinophaga sp. sic0106]